MEEGRGWGQMKPEAVSIPADDSLGQDAGAVERRSQDESLQLLCVKLKHNTNMICLLASSAPCHPQLIDWLLLLCPMLLLPLYICLSVSLPHCSLSHCLFVSLLLCLSASLSHCFCVSLSLCLIPLSLCFSVSLAPPC